MIFLRNKILGFVVAVSFLFLAVGCNKSIRPSVSTAEIDGTFETVGDYQIVTTNDVLLGDQTFIYLYNGKDKDVVIPATVGDKTIYGIYDNAFAGNSLESVTISEGIEAVGTYSFCGCPKLVSVTLPTTMKTLAQGSFSECIRLETINLAAVEVISKFAFKNDVSLSDVTFGDALESIGEYAFAYTSVTSIVIPESIKTISSAAFLRCEKLESITLPFIGLNNTSTKIFERVFGYIFGYTDVPSTEATQQYATDSKEYYYFIPKSLKEVNITKTTTIPAYSFNNCAYIEEINLGSTVRYIKDKAFSGCSSLDDISFPTTQLEFGNQVFSGSAWLTEKQKVSDFVTVGTVLVDASGVTGAVTASMFPSGITTIEGAFYGNTSITSVEIPNTVTKITAKSFYNCTSLTTLSYQASSTLEEIGDEAFTSCTSLTTVSIPSSIYVLGTNAFDKCSALTTITSPVVGSITTAFPTLLYATSHATFTVADSQTTLAAYTFSNLNGITTVVLGTNITSIAEFAFAGTTTTIQYSGSEVQWNAISGVTLLPSSVTVQKLG